MNELLRPASLANTPRPSAILRPGLRALAPGVERYLVRGGGSITVRVMAGDRLEVRDLEGLQPCVLKASGGDAAILGGRTGDAVIRVFGAGAPGETETFTVQRDAVLNVSAPGGVMDAARQDTATDIELVIHRAAPQHFKAGDMALPEPLADARQEFRVAAATAVAYVVKAGEYIQVIDVAGRQCTDFQCFSARKLDKGLWDSEDYCLFYNVNFPALPGADVKGTKVAHQGFRRYTAFSLEPHLSPTGRQFLWIKGGEQGRATLPGADVTANVEGYISVTPLRADLTAHDRLAELAAALA